MAIFALIGGKVHRDKMRNHIEEYLISLTHKERPVILYCPYAVKNIEKSIQKFHSLMNGLSCSIMDMTWENASSFRELLEQADMLYIGGGMSDDLIQFFKERKLDIVLKDFIRSDKVLAGSSAGAMLYSVISMGDKYAYMDNYHTYNYKMVEGLGILHLGMCPHYQNEDLIFYNDEIKKTGLVSFGIEEDTCLVIEENRFYCIKDDKTRSLYYFDPQNGYKMIPIYEGEMYENRSIRS